MKYRSLLAALTLVTFGCRNDNMSQQDPPANLATASADPGSHQVRTLYGDDGDDEEPAEPSLVAGSRKDDSAVSSSTTDFYHCYEAGNCSAPALSNSSSCRSDRDYHTTVDEKSGGVVVVSFHGGAIEPNSSELSTAIANHFGWSHYDFHAQPSEGCLNGMGVFSRMHITAINFDDPDAVHLLKRHDKALAIHGYGHARPNDKGVICVGGANLTQVRAFVAYVSLHHGDFSGYALRAVNAAEGKEISGADCTGLQGSSSSNLVNRVGGASGGLQLEMHDDIKADLLDDSAEFRELRSVFYGALSAALSS